MKASSWQEDARLGTKVSLWVIKREYLPGLSHLSGNLYKALDRPFQGAQNGTDRF
jgi:hypothetical protein